MKILVVDDSSMMRKIIRRELQKGDYEVFEALDGVDALEKIPEVQPDLITMDVDMPRLNGFETVEKIRNELKYCSGDKGKEVPIIFITANDTLEGRTRGFEIGATDFLTKPFIEGEVLSAVNALLKPQKTLQGATALIAEDSRVSRHILELILHSEGIKTIVTEDGVDAFEVLKESIGEIDMVITDFMMPVMNGDELCRKIRQDLGNKTIPVIFLSAMNERSSILKMFAAGASDYIVKPFAKEELLARIRVHLESRVLSRKLSTQVRELKRLSKLKDDFLSITSHDLKAPLNGILGFTEILMEEAPLDETHKEYLKHVQDSGYFLLSLIGDILDLGKLQSKDEDLSITPQNMGDIVQGVADTLAHMASPKGIKLEIIKKSDTGLNISGNKNALTRIFNNLLSNAIKFTPVNGEIKLVIEQLENDKISVSVIDSGIGIPEDKVPILFNKFSKISRPGTAGEKGTGLGLSITKELVERHNGVISVSSEEGKGTTFSVVFSSIDKGAEEESDDTESVPTDRVEKISAPPEKIRILLVDDNQLNLKLAQTILEKKEYEVVAASNGKDALYVYKMSTGGEEAIEPFQLIFMDLHMPVMNGVDATHEIRSFEKEQGLTAIPIIAMTADTSEVELQNCKDAGMNSFVAKPINVKRIEEEIKKLIIIDK